MQSPPADAPRKFERRLMFECVGGGQFFLRVAADEARLLPPASLTGHWIALARVDAAWRGRYASKDVSFRDDGDVAMLEIGRQTYTGCVAMRDRASLAEAIGGVHFQAFGHDPSWTFEITQNEFALTVDGGARQVQVPFREPIDSGTRITFRSFLGTQELVATIDRVACYDSPTRETFENTVAVMFDNAWYYGCGRFVRYR